MKFYQTEYIWSILGPTMNVNEFWIRLETFIEIKNEKRVLNMKKFNREPNTEEPKVRKAILVINHLLRTNAPR